MNQEKEKLCLKWNEFQLNAISAFGALREDTGFADVTLACEDGQQVEAHKVILASSSPFFLKLLRRNKHPHPLIYMRGLKSEDLVAMLDFLYFGEANVYQKNLDSFLAVAEELQLKCLMGPGAGEEEKEEEGTENIIPKTKNKPPKPLQQRTYHKKNVITPDLPNSVAKVEPSPPLEGTAAVTDFTVAADLQDLDVKIKSMMEFSENHVGGAPGKGFNRICKVCGKEGRWSDIQRHIEANHITGVSHTCNICGTTTRTRHAMANHKSTNHTANLKTCFKQEMQ